MSKNQVNIPLPPPSTLKQVKRRRDLLPWWVIASIWLFIAFFAMMPIGVIWGFMKGNFNISLLGFQTNEPFSLVGIFLILLFTFKGITALSLWTEKIWAAGLAKVDALISIVICCLSMAAALFVSGHPFSIRLELIILIPYFYKMNSIQYAWINFDEEVADPIVIDEILPETNE